MDCVRMEPIASCYAVLLHEPELRNTIAASRESRAARPAPQLPRAMNRARDLAARLRAAVANTRFASIVRSPAHRYSRQRKHGNVADAA